MGKIPDEPPVYNFMQTAYDPSVAPPGHHTISSIVRYTPYNLRHGTWEERLEELKEKFISINEDTLPT
jgi:phytoene dehydrogenase-like protein